MSAAAVLLAAAAATPAAASFVYHPPADPPVYQVAPAAPPGSLAGLIDELVDGDTEVVWADGTDPGQAAPADAAGWQGALAAAGLSWVRDGTTLTILPVADVAAPPEPEVWRVAPGELLADVLARWGGRAGVAIVWLTDRRWRIDQGVTFRGTFDQATRSLLFGLSHLAFAPVAQFAPAAATLAIVHRPPGAPGPEP